MITYIFGYGSIINNTSRAAGSFLSERMLQRGPSDTDELARDDDEVAVAVALAGSFGYIRKWIFRSDSGFTALGLVKDSGPVQDCQGILFQVESNKLTEFDHRELGYHRVPVPVEKIKIIECAGNDRRRDNLEIVRKHLRGPKSQKVAFYCYVPDCDRTFAPTAEYPILQTYVDVCVRGCIQWGGEALAKAFLASTNGWSTFYLNDAPMSRRPWLHRSNYAIIDKCIEEANSHTLFTERRHPEEFAAVHLTVFRGMWAVPPRNKTFVGRDEVIRGIYSSLTNSMGRKSLVQSAIVGIGGVGKSQIAIEYCHRCFNVDYDLICWLRAENPASIAASLRQLAFDLGIIEIEKFRSVDGVSNANYVDDFTVAEEVKRRLGRCRCRWLLVFDNLEEPSIIQHFLPSGLLGAGAPGDQIGYEGKFTGHVLVTSRLDVTTWAENGTCHRIECFSPSESEHFLVSALNDGEGNLGGGGIDEAYILQDLYILAEKMGHLPLALSMAAAYMQR
jgi:hypothetical protein